MSTNTTFRTPQQAKRPRRSARGRRGLTATSAAAIGVASTSLEEALSSGRSIAAVANDQGVLAETVVSALVEELRVRLAADVRAGRISADDAAELVAHSVPGLVDLVTRRRPLRNAA